MRDLTKQRYARSGYTTLYTTLYNVMLHLTTQRSCAKKPNQTKASHLHSVSLALFLILISNTLLNTFSIQWSFPESERESITSHAQASIRVSMTFTSWKKKLSINHSRSINSSQSINQSINQFNQSIQSIQSINQSCCLPTERDAFSLNLASKVDARRS